MVKQRPYVGLGCHICAECEREIDKERFTSLTPGVRSSGCESGRRARNLLCRIRRPLHSRNSPRGQRDIGGFHPPCPPCFIPPNHRGTLPFSRRLARRRRRARILLSLALRARNMLSLAGRVLSVAHGSSAHAACSAHTALPPFRARIPTPPVAPRNLPLEITAW